MQKTQAKHLVRYCEARTRSGKLCKRTAGWGTKHPGTGRCKNHLGATKNHEAKAARDQAREFLSGWDGALVPIDPLDAAVKAVELAHGRVEHTREQMLDVYLTGETPTGEEHERYRLALQDLSRMTEAANRAGVADRMAALTERAVDQITLAFEQTLMAHKDALSAAVRIAMGQTFAAQLSKVESEQLALPAGE